jgi:hypothetical protein
MQSGLHEEAKATMARAKSNGNSAQSSATIGFEAKLWLTADKLRNPFEEKMPRLVAELESQFMESAKLEAAIRNNLKGLGYK